MYSKQEKSVITSTSRIQVARMTALIEELGYISIVETSFGVLQQESEIRDSASADRTAGQKSFQTPDNSVTFLRRRTCHQ